jgi:hypothetical protein
MATSCLVLGESTATDNIVTGPGKASIRQQRRNPATPSAAASYNDDAVTMAVWVMPSVSVKDTGRSLARFQKIRRKSSLLMLGRRRATLRRDDDAAVLAARAPEKATSAVTKAGGGSVVLLSTIVEHRT